MSGGVINPTGAEKVLGQVQKKVLSWPWDSSWKDMKRSGRAFVHFLDFSGGFKAEFICNLLEIS